MIQGDCNHAPKKIAKSLQNIKKAGKEIETCVSKPSANHCAQRGVTWTFGVYKLAYVQLRVSVVLVSIV
jgi:hypothetical protein